MNYNTPDTSGLITDEVKNESNINPHILRYIESVENGTIRACREQHQLCALVRRALEDDDVYTDNEQLEKYLGLAKYYSFEQLFPWEVFCFALHMTTYRRSNGMPRFPDLFLFIGRGAGKDGYISFTAMCAASPYCGIRSYDVDICANNEDQAMRPVRDLIETLDEPKNIKKLLRFFHWNKEQVTGLRTKSVVKGRTNSPKGKDGLRSGMVIFNEIHQYPDYRNIDVFTTGLGKKKHPRMLYATTNGDVREGPLDDIVDRAHDILNGIAPDDGLIPFICKLDDENEVDDPENWQKANPSLPYLPDLMAEITKEYKLYKKKPHELTGFMVKRMNMTMANALTTVTSWDNITATNAELPDVTGCECVVGVDFSKINDWAAVCHHFRIGDQRIDIVHAWMCSRTHDLPYIKAPWREWAERGLLTVIDDIEIPPRAIADYIESMAQKYPTLCVACDNYRISMLSHELNRIGVNKDNKNLYLTRPSDIMKTSPVIDSVFENRNFIWGDNPMLRWATNNAFKIPASKNIDCDTGNTVYGKIERHGRKTDPFMAMVAAMSIEGKLSNYAGDGGSIDVNIATW